MGYNVGRVNNFVYHLEHAMGQNSWFINPYMQSNNNEWEKIQKFNEQELKEYYLKQEYLQKYEIYNLGA